MAHPEEIDSLQKLQVFTGKLLKTTKINRDDLLKLISKHYGPISENALKEQLKTEKRFSINVTDSAITVVNDIVHVAVRLRASDIHLEPFELEMGVRFRIDGRILSPQRLPIPPLGPLKYSYLI